MTAEREQEIEESAKRLVRVVQARKTVEAHKKLLEIAQSFSNSTTEFTVTAKGYYDRDEVKFRCRREVIERILKDNLAEAKRALVRAEMAL